jgi:peptidoglycan/LPS O-acetylase OafA/YrhL
LTKKVVLPLTIIMWVGTLFTTPDWPQIRFEGLFGGVDETLRLTALFLTGACFFLYRDRIAYQGGLAALAAIGLFVSLFNHATAGPAVGIFGGYLTFWFAFLPDTPKLNAINSKTDVSYGIYLYAWPIQMLSIRYIAGISPVSLIGITTISAGLLAYVSWRFLERPALSLKATFDLYTVRRDHLLSSKNR